jgi:hypothetical protein
MKTEGITSIRWALLVAAWLGMNPILAQQFLRAPAAPGTDLVSSGLLTRTFKISPNAFLFEADDAITTGPLVENKTTQERVRDYFSAAGIDLSGSGSRFFFNERTGELTVQGTIAQLEAVENAVQALTRKAVHVAIEVRFLETTSTVGNARMNALLPQLESDDFVLPSLPLQTPEDSKGLLRTAVLTHREIAKLVRSAEQTEGIDILSTPRTVTISGRRARIAAVEPSETITDPPIHGGRRIKLNAE